MWIAILTAFVLVTVCALFICLALPATGGQQAQKADVRRDFVCVDGENHTYEAANSSARN